MSIFKDDILEEAGNEIIEAIVIGNMGWGDYGSENVPTYAESPKNKVLSWEEAMPFLSYEYDSGYGSPGCQRITAWTKSKVIFISQYDGSTTVESVPRNPIDHEPNMPGG